MTQATVTSKGQITIPKSVRQQLHLHTGDKVDFVVREGGEVLFRPVCRCAHEVFGRLAKRGRSPLSVEEMDDAVRQAMAKERP